MNDYIRFCIACGNDAEAFLPGPNGRLDARCPSCGSLERHRLLALLVELLRGALPRMPSILHVGEKTSLAPVVTGLGLNVTTVQGAVAAGGTLPLADQSIDLVIVTETHTKAPTDVADLVEVLRVLRPTGAALLQVPLHASAPPTSNSAGPGECTPSTGFVITEVSPPLLLTEAARRPLAIDAAEPVWFLRPTPDALNLAGATRIEKVLMAATHPGPARRPRRLGFVDGQRNDGAKAITTRHEFLAAIHHRLQPRTYLEIGVQTGASLALSETIAIGVDPDFRVSAPLTAETLLVKATSDEFFSRDNALSTFEGTPVDLAFIDGQHLAEYAFRDFRNVELRCERTSVVVLDDVLPRTQIEAARNRKTEAWAGDVFKALEIIAEVRPDLTIIAVDTQPTGTALVFGLNPSSTELWDVYDDVVDRLTADDPQEVPEHVLQRHYAIPADVVMESPVWDLLRTMRDGTLSVDAQALDLEFQRLADVARAGNGGS